jgi:hypothetical protein
VFRTSSQFLGIELALSKHRSAALLLFSCHLLRSVQNPTNYNQPLTPYERMVVLFGVS